MKLKQKIKEAYQFATHAYNGDERIPDWIKKEYDRKEQQFIDALNHLDSPWIFRLLAPFFMKKEERMYIRYLKNRLKIEDIPVFDPGIKETRYKVKRLHRFYPGYYRFLLPYLPKTMGKVKEESGHYRVKSIWVDVHIGRKEDLREGRLATILITDPVGGGFANFVEDICAQIRNSFFPSFFEDECMLEEKHVRWIDVQSEVLDWHGWTSDKLIWNEKSQSYSWPNTEWERVPKDDWCFVECIQHFRNKANIARQVIDRDRWQLKKDAPYWVINMYHDALYNNASYDDNPQFILEEIYDVLWYISQGEKTSVYGDIEKTIYQHIYAQKPPFKKERYVEEYDIEDALKSIKEDQPTYQT